MVDPFQGMGVFKDLFDLIAQHGALCHQIEVIGLLGKNPHKQKHRNQDHKENENTSGHGGWSRFQSLPEKGVDRGKNTGHDQAHDNGVKKGGDQPPGKHQGYGKKGQKKEKHRFFRRTLSQNATIAVKGSPFSKENGVLPV
jgi:hypothetical protein